MEKTDPERFGGYRVLRRLDGVGPVRVCEAHDESLNRRVILCWLPEETDAETRESFLNAARTVSAADSRHLPMVYEIVGNSAVSYWVLETSPGGSLADWLSGFPPTVLQTVRIGRELADALLLTESLGLIPVSLQTGNVWLERRRDAGGSRESDAPVVRLRDFRSIEPDTTVAARRQVLSDFGRILFRMLSGTEPESATTAAGSQPPLSTLAPQAPTRLVQLVNELLAAGSDQNDGCQPLTFASLASCLESIERRTTSRRASLTKFASVAAVLAVGSGLWWFSQLGGSEPRREEVSPGTGPHAVSTTNNQPAETPDVAGAAAASSKPASNPATQPVEVVVAAVVEPKFEPLAPGWREIVQTLDPRQQMDAVKLELRRRNSAWDGDIRDVHISDGKVLGFVMTTDDITDISPISALSGLTWFVCPGTTSRSGKLADLSPLAGLPLVRLQAGWTQVSDLSPLAGMPLKELNLGATQVVDLSPLAGMPLESLAIWGNAIRDLRPLAELKELRQLRIGYLPARDLTPLTGLPLERLDCEQVFPRDWSPLATLPLTTLKIDYDRDLHRDLLRSIETLDEINGQPATDVLGP